MKKITKILFFVFVLTLSLSLFACGEDGDTLLCKDGHLYDNGCDVICNECGAKRVVGEHVYDDDCDPYCNECLHERIPYNHSYDNACDVTCNICLAGREVGRHMDGDGDARCDDCGARLECRGHADENRDSICDFCFDTLPGASTELGTETVESITVTTLPKRTLYYTGEEFDPTGMTVTATNKGGEEFVVTDYVIDVVKSLTEDIKAVHVYYGGRVASIKITVSEIPLVNVSKAIFGRDGDKLFVTGYYLGESDVDEFLIKDVETDAVMRVYGCPYSYAVGDLLRFVATYTVADETYLEYSSQNKDKDITVVSSGNSVECLFTTTTGVASWSRMKNVFRSNILRENVYINFSGEFYIYRDASGDYFIHMNNDASGISDIRPDGTRAVKIAAGTKGAELIESLAPSREIDTLPGKLYSGELYAIYTGFDGDSYNLIIADSSWLECTSAVTEEQLALREVAYAFYYKGNKIHYDQYGTRRNINPVPELATSDYRLHLDCSSYVNAVYYTAFGENIMPYPTTERSAQTGVLTNYAEEFLGINPDVVGYWENADYNEEEAAELLAEIKAGLQIGDVLVYRRTANTGHALIYVGNGYFLHSTGGSYEYDTENPLNSYDQASNAEKAGGTISLLSVKNVFDDSSSGRYLFASNVNRFAVLRPMERGLTVNAQTEARLTIPGVSVEKTASVSMSGSVRVGGALIYTITLTNNTDSEVDDVIITDVIPYGTLYLGGSAGIVVTGDELLWTGTVAPKSTVSVVYVVEVCEEAFGKPLVSEGGTVNGLLLTPITHTVSKYSKNFAEEFAENAKALIEAGVDIDKDPIELVNKLYLGVVGEVLSTADTSLGILDALIDTETDTYRSDSEIYSMLVPNLYGGYAIKSGYRIDNERFRLVCERNLAVGDVIVAEYGENVDVYVYIGDGSLVKASTGIDSASIVEIGSDEYKNVLVSLIAYNRYVILRPSAV